MSTWTDEQKDEVVAKYQDAEPNAENSMEIVKEIADEVGRTANAVRMILSQKGVYITKAPATKSSGGSASSGEGKTTRVSKDAAQQALTAAIEEAGAEVDSEIISKLTGKAAQYFTGVLKAAAGSQED